MFSTLVGAYPRTPLPGQPFALRAAHARLERGEIDQAAFRAAQDALVRELLAEQVDAGLELLTDGQVRWDDPQTAIAGGLQGFEITGLLRYFDTNTYYRQPRALQAPRWTAPITLEDWRFARDAAAELAQQRGVDALPVKQCVVGPYTLARLSDPGEVGREALTLALAEALNQELVALHAAGAPVIQLDENALTLVGPDDAVERDLALEALRRVTWGLEDAHLCLAITMGHVVGFDPERLFGLPFRSYLFDLVAGPANWDLIARAPGACGIVCGVADARNTRPDDPAFMVRAAYYAASTGGRGLDRVALAPSTSLEYLPRDRARAKIRALGEAARMAALADPGALAEAVDPRSVGPHEPAPASDETGAERAVAADRGGQA